jgi:hypothetical protein
VGLSPRSSPNGRCTAIDYGACSQCVRTERRRSVKYVWDAGKGRLVAHGITVLTFKGEQIDEITAFLTPDAFARFELPTELSDKSGVEQRKRDGC